MSLQKKLFIGCLGALSPIIANLLVVDLDLVLANAKLLTVVSYIIRVVALCGAACIVVYLNSDEDKPIKVFQLGIAAPALSTASLFRITYSSRHRSKFQRLSAVPLPSRRQIQGRQIGPKARIVSSATRPLRSKFSKAFSAFCRRIAGTYRPVPICNCNRRSMRFRISHAVSPDDLTQKSARPSPARTNIIG